MDKGENPLSVEDIIKLFDAAKDRGIGVFEGAGIKFTSTGVVRSQAKRQKIVPPKPEPKNAVDLALDLNGRTDEDEST